MAAGASVWVAWRPAWTLNGHVSRKCAPVKTDTLTLGTHEQPAPPTHAPGLRLTRCRAYTGGAAIGPTRLPTESALSALEPKRPEWTMPPEVDVTAALRAAVGGHPLVARILCRRGVCDPRHAAAFLDPSLYTPSPPDALPGVLRAASVAREVAGAGGRVRVWGDPDADGVTAAAVLAEALWAADIAADYRMPRPGEGHGLPPRAVDEALRDGISLIVTVDTGITEHEAVRLARSRGLRVVVTDHHDVAGDLPGADAVVNPEFLPADHPQRHLSGAAVAYQLGRALLAGAAVSARHDPLDLVAIGLITDLVPLVGDCRYLAQRGLDALRATARPGLMALMQVCRIDGRATDGNDVSFRIGPRLNAMARLASAQRCVELVSTGDPGVARRLAEEADALNRSRQARADAATAAAEEQLRRDPELARQGAIIIEGEGWDGGTRGAVAAALAQRFERPAIVLSRSGDGTMVASARSVPGVDVHAAIVAHRGLLEREGGHPMAAGFTVREESLEALRSGLLATLEGELSRRTEAPALAVDAVVGWDDVGLPLARELGRLAPFGPGNARPVLLLPRATVARIEGPRGPTGRQSPTVHLASGGGHTLRVLSGDADPPPVGAEVDVALHLGIRRWRGRESLEARLVAHRPAGRGEAAAPVSVGGVDIIDLRREPGAGPRLQRLLDRYPGLVVWAEGPDAPEGAVSRVELAPGAEALAVAWAPPGPEELADALERVEPGVVVLLAAGEIPPTGIEETLRSLAGMVRRAAREGRASLEVPRMAARLGARRGVVEAGLEYLLAAGHPGLVRDGAGAVTLVAHEGADRVRDEEGCRAALEALRRLLQETAAYRAAYAVEPPGALLSARRSSA